MNEVDRQISQENINSSGAHQIESDECAALFSGRYLMRPQFLKNMNALTLDGCAHREADVKVDTLLDMSLRSTAELEEELRHVRAQLAKSSLRVT
jgi:hypothetical protein